MPNEEIKENEASETVEEIITSDAELTDAETTDESEALDVNGELDGLSEEFPRLRAEEPEALLDTQRYRELRALGLSSREAYLATAKRSEIRQDSRAHLSGSVPKRAHPLGTGMSTQELSLAREIFGSMSDEDIRSLYRRVTKQ